MKFISKKDIIFIIAILFIAAIIYFIFNYSNKNTAVKAEIYYDNNIVKTIDLSEDKEIEYEINPNIIFSVKDGSIAFLHSDCPDKVCVNTGYIKSIGQVAVCLPNKTVVKIVGDNKEVDGVL